MRHLAQLSFLILATGTAAVAHRRPSCPNDQLPKLDRSGRPIQCLPGSSSRSVCGVNHMCFFSGMNYMCCPSNEPSHTNQPACPPPTLTVLDPHGLPLKCNPRSRTCPQEGMVCSDVGLAYICCERVHDTLHSNSVTGHDRKLAPQRKNVRKLTSFEETLDCPSNSIGLLNGDGSRVLCNSRTRCPGRNTFCHGALKRSICCEKFEFASNILDPIDSSTGTTSIRPMTANAVVRLKMAGSKTLKSTAPVDNSARLESLWKASSKKKVMKSSVQATPEASHAEVHSSKADASETAEITSSSTLSPTVQSAILQEKVDGPAWLSTTTSRPRDRPPTRAHGIVQTGDSQPSPTLPSQLFSKQDKRAMAQQFLMHQIRNGWPYEDRFYRPDLDAFSPEQRRDMARIQFSDN